MPNSGDVLRPIGLQMAFELSCSDGPQPIPALEFQAINGELAPSPAPAAPPEPAVEAAPPADPAEPAAAAPVVPEPPPPDAPDPGPALAEAAPPTIEAPPAPVPDPEAGPPPVTVLVPGEQPRIVKAVEVSGVPGLLFRRNSQSGAVEVLPRSGDGVVLNAALHA